MAGKLRADEHREFYAILNNPFKHILIQNYIGFLFVHSVQGEA